MIMDFESKYPNTAKCSHNMREKGLPYDTSLWIGVNASILMMKLDRGDYNEYRKTKCKLPNEVIDMFGKTYMENALTVAEKVYNMTGEYERMKTVKALDPDAFFEKLINQYIE